MPNKERIRITISDGKRTRTMEKLMDITEYLDLISRLDVDVVGMKRKGRGRPKGSKNKKKTPAEQA